MSLEPVRERLGWWLTDLLTPNPDLWVSHAVIFAPLVLCAGWAVRLQRRAAEAPRAPWWIALPWYAGLALLVLSPQLVFSLRGEALLAAFAGACAIHLACLIRRSPFRSRFVRATGPFLGLASWSGLWTLGLIALGAGGVR